ncbi:hypothetical protein TeGR_g6699 [Tetraparma gracilis]|uniref:Large ribosomal subunit protein uL29m n=1 Tax=Tetraparma gracilis TaxID=2962635 RepID=A0ABQ6N066_9STRA|nr:hypothetical protein TeGR_g6699 [Tetraparma gracilis]
MLAASLRLALRPPAPPLRLPPPLLSRCLSSAASSAAPPAPPPPLPTPASPPPKRWVTFGTPNPRTRYRVPYHLRNLGLFFQKPLPRGETHKPAGRAWTLAELRGKSFADLHALWFVLLRERNLLLTEIAQSRRAREPFRDPGRRGKVREGMQRIRQVMGERGRGLEFGEFADGVEDGEEDE